MRCVIFTANIAVEVNEVSKSKVHRKLNMHIVWQVCRLLNFKLHCGFFISELQ